MKKKRKERKIILWTQEVANVRIHFSVCSDQCQCACVHLLIFIFLFSRPNWWLLLLCAFAISLRVSVRAYMLAVSRNFRIVKCHDNLGCLKSWRFCAVNYCGQIRGHLTSMRPSPVFQFQFGSHNLLFYVKNKRTFKSQVNNHQSIRKFRMSILLGSYFKVFSYHLLSVIVYKLDVASSNSISVITFIFGLIPLSKV